MLDPLYVFLPSQVDWEHKGSVTVIILFEHTIVELNSPGRLSWTQTAITVCQGVQHRMLIQWMVA